MKHKIYIYKGPYGLVCESTKTFQYDFFVIYAIELINKEKVVFFPFLSLSVKVGLTGWLRVILEPFKSTRKSFKSSRPPQKNVTIRGHTLKHCSVQINCFSFMFFSLKILQVESASAEKCHNKRSHFKILLSKNELFFFSLKDILSRVGLYNAEPDYFFFRHAVFFFNKTFPVVTKSSYFETMLNKNMWMFSIYF